MSGSTADWQNELNHYRDYLGLIAQAVCPVGLQAKFDASDLVQQTLLHAHSRLDQFRGDNSAQFARWLREILRTKLVDQMRQLYREKRDVRREQALDERFHDSVARLEQWMLASQLSPSQQASQHEQLMRLPAAIARLPAAQRQAVVMYHIQGMTLSEVAGQLGRTESAVGGLLHRGLQRLKTLMVPDR